MELKESVLKELSQHRDTYISGEDLAARFGVTRSAVWKCIRSLQKEGAEIVGVRNKGYRIVAGGDILSAAVIESFRKGSDPLDIRVYPSVGSTNDVLKEAALAGAKEGTVVTAEKQTAGKGRSGRRFFSPEKSGIYMSILLRPSFAAETASLLTTAAAAATALAVEEVCGKSPGIKWVNDLFLDGRKICGILTEAAMSVENNGLEYVIVGIGLNIDRPDGDFPDEIREIAGAVYSRHEAGTEVRNRLIASILDHFFEYYRHMDERAFAEVYRERLFFLGDTIEILCPEGIEEAVAVDITDDCYLIVEDRFGRRKELCSGEIRIKVKK